LHSAYSCLWAQVLILGVFGKGQAMFQFEAALKLVFYRKVKGQNQQTASRKIQPTLLSPQKWKDFSFFIIMYERMK